MATQTLDGYDKFLKEWYLSSWIDQLNSMTTVWKLFRKKLVDFSGRRMIIPIRTSRNTGIGAVPNSSGGSVPTLMTAGSQGIENAICTPAIVTGAIQISQDVMDASKNNRGAFYEVVDFEMRGLVQDMAEDLDRQMCGNGSGTLATINTGTSSVETCSVSTHRPFFTGMIVDFWSTPASGATKNAEDITITDVTRNSDGSGAISWSGAETVTQGGAVAKANVRTATAGYEMMGVDGIVDSADPPLLDSGGYLGIDRSTAGNGYWIAYEKALGAAFTEEDIQNAFDAAHDNSNGDVNCLLMNRLTRGSLYATLATSNPRRFVDTNVVKSGYLSGKVEDQHPDGQDWLFWDGRVPIIVDKFAFVDIDDVVGPAALGNIYGLDLSSFFMALVTDFKWWSPEGQILHRSDSRAFSVMADMYIYGNLVCDAPRKNFKIQGDIS